MDTKQRIIVHSLCSIPFVIVWMFIVTALSVAEREGILSVIRDAFGEFGVWMLRILAVVAIASIIYLPMVAKKELSAQLLAYFLTIVFCICMIVCVKVGDNMFCTFSPELWRNYPGRRITMYESLKNQYGLIGYRTEEIEALLGKPDFIVNDDVYVYEATHENALYIDFEDGESINFYYVD